MLFRKYFRRIFRRQEAESVAGLINKLVPQESSVFRRNAANTHNSKLHGPQSNYSILSRELTHRSPPKTSNSISIRESAFYAKAREAALEDNDVSLNFARCIWKQTLTDYDVAQLVGEVLPRSEIQPKQADSFLIL